MIALTSGFIDEIDAIKAKGSSSHVSPKSYGSANQNVVCGDKLCSEIESIKIEKDNSISKSVEKPDLVKPSKVTHLSTRDSFELEAKPVLKEINGEQHRMYAYNGQIPGPMFKVKQGSTVFFDFTNNLDMDTTVHWHGVRIDNEFDGSPVTQEFIKPGQSFLYKVTFPDYGMNMYHPHVRTDIQMELGLYGNILVEPTNENQNQVDHEVAIMLDDILIEDGEVDTFSRDYIQRALMGRFGNTMFINGEQDYNLDVKTGEIVRFHLTNPANTRTFNFSIDDHQIKLVGGDSSRYEKETLIDSVIISPGEIYSIEVLFEKPGAFKIFHNTPDKTYILGSINVSEESYDNNNSSDFYNLKENDDVISDIEPYKKYISKEPDYELELTMESFMMEKMDSDMVKSDHDIEWEDTVPTMNSMSTNENTKWILRDKATGKENLDVNYQMKVGDIKKIRFFNNPDSAHPMQHPIHLHGQRFLITNENGVTNDNLVWKDTVLIPTGSIVDVIVDVTNPGVWIMHCHILEHAESGMIVAITVNS
jgi:FtsP/CotA-like multicopper oxidase with cupredoxin domain